MAKIKICGLRRLEDILIVNEAIPDYIGFIIGYEKSRRNITVGTLENLSPLVDKRIKKVGVFVNSPLSFVLSLLDSNLIDIAQLHGSEDEEYIKAIVDSGYETIKSFKVEEAGKAYNTCANYPLFDNANPGSGMSYSWDSLKDFKRPYFLAGGIGEDNALNAINKLNPFALDVSSKVESDGFKDRAKILNLTSLVREKKTRA